MNTRGCQEPGITIKLLLIWMGGLSKSRQYIIIKILNNIKKIIKSFILDSPCIEKHKRIKGLIRSFGSEEILS